VRALLAWSLVTVLPVALLRWVDPPTTAFIELRKAEARRRNEVDFVVRQSWVPRRRIAPHLQLAVVAAEDQKFPWHWGFDVEAIEDALEDRLEGKSTRGASTLTQQVAKNLFLWPGRSLVRKALEAYFTLLLELLLPKGRILELHLNVAEYGDGIYGVEAASKHAFGKGAAAVTPVEAAMLAVVLPSPRTRKVNAPTPKARQRIEWILQQCENLGPRHLEGL
jgi:monofunctional biosynthetic peptidoglycan transglycosylase